MEEELQKGNNKLMLQVIWENREQEYSRIVEHMLQAKISKPSAHENPSGNHMRRLEAKGAIE